MAKIICCRLVLRAGLGSGAPLLSPSAGTALALCSSSPQGVGGKDRPLFAVVFTSKIAVDITQSWSPSTPIFRDAPCVLRCELGIFSRFLKIWFRNTFISAPRWAGWSGCAGGTTQHFAGVAQAAQTPAEPLMRMGLCILISIPTVPPSLSQGCEWPHCLKAEHSSYQAPANGSPGATSEQNQNLCTSPLASKGQELECIRIL